MEEQSSGKGFYIVLGLGVAVAALGVLYDKAKYDMGVVQLYHDRKRSRRRR